jgi:hypothetical protein
LTSLRATPLVGRPPPRAATPASLLYPPPPSAFASAALYGEVAFQEASDFQAASRRLEAEVRRNDRTLVVGSITSERDPSTGTPVDDPATRLRVALAALVFAQLDREKALPPVMSTVREELMGALYVGANRAGASNDSNPLNFPSFIDLETYADVYARQSRELRLPRAKMFERMHRSEVKRVAELHGLRRGAERAVLGCVFRAWRHVSRTRPERLAQQFISLTTRKNEDDVRRRYFVKWGGFVDEIAATKAVHAKAAKHASATSIRALQMIKKLELGRRRTKASEEDSSLRSPTVTAKDHRASYEATTVAAAAIEELNSQVEILKKQVASLGFSLKHLVPHNAMAEALLRSHSEERVQAKLLIEGTLDLPGTVVGGSFATHSPEDGPLQPQDSFAAVGKTVLGDSDRALKQSRDATAALLGSTSPASGALHVGVEAPLAFVEKVAMDDMLLRVGERVAGCLWPRRPRPARRRVGRILRRRKAACGRGVVCLPSPRAAGDHGRGAGAAAYR